MNNEPHHAGPAADGDIQRSAWAQRGERGSLLALRFMAWLAVSLGRPLARAVLHPITLYFLLFGATARRHSARYLQRALGRKLSWRDQYRHFHCFASTVLDRVYFVREQTSGLDIKLYGDEGCQDSLARREGVFLIGAHLGSFESLGTVGKQVPGMQVTMVMYPDNARQIQSVLQAMAPNFKLDIIAIGKPGSTLAIREALQRGRLVGLLGDRFLHADSTRAAGISIPFLGQPALFSDGPWRLAMLLRRRVVFMVGLFLGGRSYDLRFETMADFRDPPQDPAARDALIQAALHNYVARLESLCREAPYNWFNFYDYWHEDPVQT